jgi:hypothetical protein
MNGKASPTTRVAAAIAAVIAIPVFAQSATAFDGRSPDTRSVALVNQTGAGLLLDLRSPDTRTAAANAGATTAANDPAIQVASTSGTVLDLRSPDTRDAISTSPAAATRAVSTSSDGFSWSDFGLGAGVTAGSLLLLAGLGAGAVTAGRRRQRPSTI